MATTTETKESLLFTPITLRGVTLKNRICVAPMCQYSATGRDGVATDWHMVSTGAYAQGGAGLVMLEATAVEARGRISPGCLGLWQDDQIEPLARIARFIKGQGSVPAIQLAHAGRKASTVVPWDGHHSLPDSEGGWPTIGPSALAFGTPVWKVPKEATIDDINKIKEAWVGAAIRAVKAGFELIELHFAHGYLVSTFLSPVSNQRRDKYGGSYENRVRLALEIAGAVRQALPDTVALGVRVSVADYEPRGWDLAQTIQLARELKALGVDFLDCSSGGVSRDIDYNALNTPDTQIEAAGRVLRETGLPTGAVGKIVDPHHAENILRSGGASLIFIGRAFLDNPHWPFVAADALATHDTFQYPPQYDWCIGWKGFFKWRQEAKQGVRQPLLGMSIAQVLP
ncbi:unnamed protein product, partial [Medioppia subpectinata]